MTAQQISDELKSIYERLGALGKELERHPRLGDGVNREWQGRAQERLDGARWAVQLAEIGINITYDLKDKEKADDSSLSKV